jgi:hypothetical protein
MMESRYSKCSVCKIPCYHYDDDNGMPELCPYDLGDDITHNWYRIPASQFFTEILEKELKDTP